MWLLNTTTHALEFFADDRTLEYSILSHRWTDGEVLFHDLQNGADPSMRSGWLKLEAACEQAQRDGFMYIWIDTCCIDKSSSAELSEAINSMYRWYQNARVCYAYLYDVTSTNLAIGDHSFRESDWFTRGWTLQELIAPGKVVFYNKDWQRLGERNEIAGLITQITGIPRRILSGIFSAKRFSVAQRMSWAASRQTTRAEDMAYSLMGLFDLNMPMMYGEGGERAFVRLQEEIMKDSADQTIFAWTCRDTKSYRGLLARSPAEFAGCGGTVQARTWQRVSFQQTNLGLQISLKVRPYAMNVYHAALDVEERSTSGRLERVGIFLGCPSSADTISNPGRCLYRGHDKLPLPADICLEQMFSLSFAVPKDPFPEIEPEDAWFGFVVRSFKIYRSGRDDLTLSNGIRVVARPSTWHFETNTVTLHPGTMGTAVGFAMQDSAHNTVLFMMLGFGPDFAPWVWISPPSHIQRLADDQVGNSEETKEPLVTNSQFFYLTASGSLSNPQNMHSFDSAAEILETLPEGLYRGSRLTGVWVETERLKLRIRRAGHPQWAWVAGIKTW